MAERRMFSKAVIGSARFLRMPPTSRLLYFDLGMAADDDGIVEAFSVMRTTGANEDDLRVLASKGFVRVLNEDLVTFVCDWNVNNQLRKDRYHPSIYHELLVQLEDGNQMATIGQPSDSQTATEVSIGKVSIVEDSIGKTNTRAGKPPTPPKKAYGQYGWVKLADKTYSDLIHDLGQAEVDRCISYIDESAELTQNKNKWRNWNIVIRRCSREGWGRTQQRQQSRQALKSAVDYADGLDFFSGEG